MTVTKSDSMYSCSVAGRTTSRFPAAPCTSATWAVSFILQFPCIAFDAQSVERGQGRRLLGFLLGLACTGGGDFTGDTHFDAECFLVVGAGFFNDVLTTWRHAPGVEQFMRRLFAVGAAQSVGCGSGCALDKRLTHERAGGVQAGIKVKGRH